MRGQMFVRAREKLPVGTAAVVSLNPINPTKGCRDCVPPALAGLDRNGLAWLFNMVMLYFFGSRLEDLWGQRRFIQFLLACTVAGAVVYVLLTLLFGTLVPRMGMASVALRLMVESGMLFPVARGVS